VLAVGLRYEKQIPDLCRIQRVVDARVARLIDRSGRQTGIDVRVVRGSNPLGNVIALTDSARSVKRDYDFDAWGGLRGGTDYKPFNNTDRARFKGALWLGPQVDVIYMRARWYEPKTGRFLSEDPLGLEGGINVYAYGANDPINRSDPTGLEVCVDKLSQLRELEDQVNADISYTLKNGQYCITGVRDRGGSSAEQQFQQWSLGVWIDSRRRFTVDETWAQTAATVSRRQCRDALLAFGGNILSDVFIPLKFVRGVQRVGLGGYMILKYGPRAAQAADNLKALGYLEAGMAGIIWGASLEEGGDGYQGTAAYKVASSVPVLGSGIALGEIMIYC
jgi:RHS repeat-associated protein